MGKAFLEQNNIIGSGSSTSETVTVLTDDQVQIGDIVYTLDNSISAGFYLNAISSTGRCVFSPSGDMLIIYTPDSDGPAKVYSVSGTTITYVNDIYADNGTTPLNSRTSTAALSPSGNTLVLGGSFTGKAKVYSVSGTMITYVSDIYADNGATPLGSSVYTAVLSPSGNALILGGYFTGGAKVYGVSGTTITYVSDIYADSGTTPLDSDLITIVFSPSGNALILGGYFTGGAKVYSVSGATITYVNDIYADSGTTPLDGYASKAVFSPSGNALILSGYFTGKAKVYSVSGTTITYVNNIYADSGTTLIDSDLNTIVFSSSGNVLILGGYFTGRAKVYSVSGTTITYVSNIYADNGATPLGSVYTAVFSASGNALIIGGEFTGMAKVYSVSGTTITYVSDIYADSGTTLLDNYVYTAVFPPSGNALILSGEFTGKVKVYSVSGTTITYVNNIYADSGTTLLDGRTSKAVFSPSGNALILSGYFTGRAKVYSVSGTTITYVSDIYADSGTTLIDGYVYTAVFSPSGDALVLGGSFTGVSKVYSVSGTTITYVSDIYADSGTTLLNGYVYTAVFLPSGNALILGGSFTGRAKVYSVSGTTITYVSNIYANSGTTTLNSTVHTALFSSLSNVLILGGDFTGKAKVYSVSGTTITYVSDIYADSGTTPLNSRTSTAVFSPSGNTLVLGGYFTGGAKVYSVSGTTITYVNDIYADSGTTPLDGYASKAVFSPSGNALILSGYFTGKAKVYSVSGTTITYVNNIYADSGTTLIDGYVYTAVFLPSGDALVLGGSFTGVSKVYSVSGTTIIPYTHVKRLTNLIDNKALKFSANSVILNAKIGYCTQAKNSGEVLEIQILA